MENNYSNIQLICPKSNLPLYFSINENRWIAQDNSYSYFFKNGVITFLDETDTFYEGTYLNNIKYLPKSENLLDVLPLWLICNGYLWEVRKHFKKGDILIELGCASGVDYFGSRFNMYGLDLSFESLKGLHNYQLGLQADAAKLPFADNSVDGVISSYFWEHIPPEIKDKMLIEFKRVLKPGGKIVFLYDVETQNELVGLLKKDNPQRYQELFLDGDGHFGYETPQVNKDRFLKHGFEIVKHFGMERTWIQSNSVFEKLRHLNGITGFIGKVGNSISTGRILGYAFTFFVRLVDETLGKLFAEKKARIIISVFKTN
jgi:SAM-dependent methyltransferase